MTGELWAAIVGSCVLAGSALIGWVVKGLSDAAKEASQDAKLSHDKNHAMEVSFLTYQAKVANDLRVIEGAFFEYKLQASNDYVRRGDHTNVLAELFRKIETMGTSIENISTKLDTKFDAKLDALGKQIERKADKPPHA